MKTGLILKLDDLINWCSSRVFSSDEVFGNHRHHAPSGLVLDGASGAQRHHAGRRISERLSLPAARSRQEVLPRVSGNTGGGRREVHANSSEKSESECPRRTLGTFHQRGMLIEADFVWGELVTPRCVRFRGALSPRKKPSRQRQPLTLSCFCFGYAGIARRGPPSRATRRLTQLLRPRRMNILAKRGSDPSCSYSGFVI